eukprot:4377072-Amphidinium_carterae.1
MVRIPFLPRMCKDICRFLLMRSYMPENQTILPATVDERLHHHSGADGPQSSVKIRPSTTCKLFDARVCVVIFGCVRLCSNLRVKQQAGIVRCVTVAPTECVNSACVFEYWGMDP